MKIFLTVLFSLITFNTFPQIMLATFEVDAGEYNRNNTPISASLDGIIYMHDSLSIILEEIRGSDRINVPCQIDNVYSPRLWWILAGETNAGQKRMFQLSLGEKQGSHPVIHTIQTDFGTILQEGGKKLLQYNHALQPVPEGVDPAFKKSGFIHPLWSPDGDTLTRIQPPDHYHHYGIWGPYTRTRLKEHNTDFWNLGEKQGTVRFANYESRITGPVFGEISVLQEHVDFLAENGEKVVMIEKLTMRVWKLPDGDTQYLWDYTSSLNNIMDTPVDLLEYRYGGGIGIRVHEKWTKNNSIVLTSEGKDRLTADGTRARWCDISVSHLNLEISGVLFMSNPNNRQHPEPMRVWPLDANNGRGDMFFEFCPIRHKNWLIEPRKKYTLKYRMLVHLGIVHAEQAENFWNDFAVPPTVTRIR